MSDLWLLVRALHLLAMAFFVGGQLLLVLAVVPVERQRPDRERLRAVARRFGWGEERFAGTRHAWGEAAYRTGGTWGDFLDWVRPGR